MSVEKCVRNLTGFEGVFDEKANLNIYGLDSLRRVELVICLEEEFDINFSDGDLTQSNFETIDSINKLLREYGKI